MTLSANSATLDLHPTKDGALSNATVSVTTGTNNETGYTLTMNATSTDLTNSAASSTIPTLSSATNYDSSFPTNKWGYSILNQASPTVDTTTVFNPLAATSTLFTTSAASNADVITLALAAKADINLPSGVYNNTLQFMAVANALPVRCNPSAITITDAVCMQDMNSSIKSTMVEDQQYQLYDKRDEKVYYVAKLKDGNVWMTQNLDLDLSTSVTLTSDNTDLVAGTTYTPNVSTKTGNVFNSSSYTGENSWDGGDYYWKGPDTWLASASNSAGYGSDTFKSAFSTSIADAGDAGTHYHVGNLYQWSAATARTGNGLQSGAEATSSICPSGWRLPYSGNNTTNKSFGFMLSKYNLASSNTDHNINKTPLFFVPAGGVNSGSLYDGAYRGRYWSSRAYTEDATNYAYRLRFSTSGVNPSGSNYRYVGFSVRCVAR